MAHGHKAPIGIKNLKGERAIRVCAILVQAHSLYIWYKAMSSGPLHKSCQPCPWSQNLSTLGVIIVH